MGVKSLSRVGLFAIPWNVACQAPLSMEFARQGYWSGLSFPSPILMGGGANIVPVTDVGTRAL